MSRTLFENSKAALAFAAVTILGAVSMIGTEEDRGVLPAVAERFGTKPDEAPQPDPEPAAPAAARESETRPSAPGWYDGPPTVFGDYDGEPPEDGGPTPSESSAARADPGGNVPFNPQTAPISPTARPVG